MTRSKLYILLSAACFAGYVWVYVSYNKPTFNEFHVCLFKQITNIPCPSCGSTRSVLSLLHGNLGEAIFLNPLGLFILFIMVITPVWIFFDLLQKKSTFFDFYLMMEKVMNRKKVFIPAAFLILANWIWNIYKGL